MRVGEGLAWNGTGINLSGITDTTDDNNSFSYMPTNQKTGDYWSDYNFFGNGKADSPLQGLSATYQPKNLLDYFYNSDTGEYDWGNIGRTGLGFAQLVGAGLSAYTGLKGLANAKQQMRDAKNAWNIQHSENIQNYNNLIDRASASASGLARNFNSDGSLSSNQSSADAIRKTADGMKMVNRTL